MSAPRSAAWQRLVPQPALTAAITGLWLVLAPQFTSGHLLLGLAAGLAIPHATSAFWPDRPRLKRPLRALALFARLVGDILTANWQVARLVTGPLDRLLPKFVEVPLDIDDPFVATLLAGMVSLTPGTVSIDIDQDRKVLLVHALVVSGEAELIGDIKARYEAPLKEIFQC